MKTKEATYGSIYGVNTHFAEKNTMKERLTVKDIKKAAKKLEKPIKGDIINLDTIRKGVNFLSKYNLSPLSEDKKIFKLHRYYK